jgi:hypothetical protein
MAMMTLAASAMTPAMPCWAGSDAAVRLAMPAAQEETVYRPECPADEISSGWAGCRIAGVGG